MWVFPIVWLGYESERERLTWDSNRVALCELHGRLRGLSNTPMQRTRFGGR